MTATAIIPAEDYRRRFSTGLAAEVLCGACPNFGSCWNCPPFGESPFDTAASRHKSPAVVLVLMKTESHNTTTMRNFLEEILRQTARDTGGTAFGTGGCRLCAPENTETASAQTYCARAKKQPCRNPGKAIPSLEACGFDLNATASELLGTKLDWNPEAPATFIGAVITDAGRAEHVANIITNSVVDTNR